MLGQRSSADGTTGYYQAFDVTPPGMVTRIVTAKGVFEPSSVSRQFAGDQASQMLPGS